MRRERQRVRREVQEQLVESVEIPPLFFMPQVPVVEDPREDPAWLREWREMMEEDIRYYQHLDALEEEEYWDRDQLAYDPVDCSWQHDWD